MTLAETKQLGIEFERRLHTIVPQTELQNKLDTQTIYSFLNQYQDKYIDTLYKGSDSIESGTNIQANIEKIMQHLLYTKKIQPSALLDSDLALSSNSLTFVLPYDFGKYIRSNSIVTSMYRFGGNADTTTTAQSVPNILVSEKDANRYAEAPNNSLRIIRNPIAILSNDVINSNWVLGDNLPGLTFYDTSDEETAETVNHNTLTLIHDRYTTVTDLVLTYYRLPQHFSILTNTPCQLPMDAFDDIVTGAVDLYITHLSGGRKPSQKEQEPKEQNKEQQQ